MSNYSNAANFRILVVDDSYEARQFLKLIITNKFGCEVLEAQNGQEALRIVYNEKPNLVLLDIMMPIMDGYEFLKILRADRRTARLPVIICSAVGEKNTVFSFLEEGITDYILKPINLPLVYSKIEKILKKTLSKYMEFSINDDGVGYFFSEPFPKDFYIKVTRIEGAYEDDQYVLQIGNEEPRNPAKVTDRSIIKIPEHDHPLKLTFRFAITRNKVITIYFEILD